MSGKKQKAVTELASFKQKKLKSADVRARDHGALPFVAPCFAPHRFRPLLRLQDILFKVKRLAERVKAEPEVQK